MSTNNGETVSFNDTELNEKLEGYSIVRNSKKDISTGKFYGFNERGNSEEISRNYWENAIKVQEYLERLDRLGVLERTFNSEEDFLKLLTKLHVIQSLGLSRKKSYRGQSDPSLQLQKDWEKKYRDPNFYVRLTFDVKAGKEYLEICKKYDDEYFQNKNNFLKNKFKGTFKAKRTKISSPVDIYIPPPLLPELDVNRETLDKSMSEYFFHIKPDQVDRSGIVIFITDNNFHLHKVDKNNKEKTLELLYPSAKYINDYLNITRQSFSKIFKEKDYAKNIQSLALGYQAGIRSQAFETVWNSEMMGLVNFFLKKKLGKKPIPHADLDYLAFLVSAQTFALALDTKVNVYNT